MTDNSKINEVFIEEELKESYLSYAMSVIVGRALPDVRDGLKPVHRRILFAMNDLGITFNKAHKKSARIVGDVIGKYHPHGDSAVYEALVRLAQEFNMRYPLIDGQGNFGSIDGDSAAAMRYTEARIKKIASEIMKDIEKETVAFTPNFDESLQEPSVLPSRIPQLLINGSTGIAVGMATSIPPHNLTEIIDAALYLIDNLDISVEELVNLNLVKGPDFPTGATLIRESSIKDFYLTGQGSFKIKGVAEIEETYRKGRSAIIIKEIPYMVNKTTFIERIVELVKNGKIKDIVDISDESNKEGIRVVVEVKKGGDPNIVLNQLYKFTNLQNSFSGKCLALVNGVPKILNLKEYLENFIYFRKEIIINRTKYDLKKAEEKLHLLEGLKIALENIDDIVKLIKASKNVQEAKDSLMEKYSFSERQAQAILDMKLQKLTSLEMNKIKEDYDTTLGLIKDYKYILENDSKQFDIIKDELKEVRDSYGDERKTKIIEADGEFLTEDLIKDEDFVVMVTNNDYIKKVPLENYKSQNRGGKGNNVYVKDEDFVKDLFIANSKETILIFTDDGCVNWLKTYEVPNVSAQSKGRSIVNYIDLKGRKVMSVIAGGRDLSKGHLIFITRKGIIKKTMLENFSRPRAGGIKAINLDDGDRLVKVMHSDGDEDLLCSSNSGYSIRFKQDDLSVLGRTARGVKAMKLKDGEEVIGIELVYPGKALLTITKFGYGKRTLASDYPIIKRAGRGVIDIKTDSRNGDVVSLRSVSEDDEILIVTKLGKIIRTKVKSVRIISRNTRGVRLVRLDDDDEVISVEKIDTDE